MLIITCCFLMTGFASYGSRGVCFNSASFQGRLTMFPMLSCMCSQWQGCGAVLTLSTPLYSVCKGFADNSIVEQCLAHLSSHVIRLYLPSRLFKLLICRCRRLQSCMSARVRSQNQSPPKRALIEYTVATVLC